MDSPKVPGLVSLVFKNLPPDRAITVRDIVTRILPDIESLFYKQSVFLENSYILVGDSSNKATGVPVSGEAAISSNGAITLSNLSVISKILTGYISGAGTISAADTILQAFQKINGNVDLLSNQTLPNLVPTGSMQMWGTATAPTNWLLCNGSSVLRASYTNLFSVIGTTFGSVDGTHFTLPDFRGYFPFGKSASGTGSTLAGTFGTIDHNHTADPPNTNTSSNGAHTHTVSVAGENATVLSDLAQVGADGTYTSSSDGTHTHSVDISSFNTGSNNPPGLAINFIIKT